MSKPLGNKRHEICDDQRDDIARRYGTFREGEHIRILDNEDLGDRRITVEHPLRLSFAVEKDRIAKLKKTKAFTNLAISKKRKDTKAAKAEIEVGRRLQEGITTAVESLMSLGIVKDRDEFSKRLRYAFKKDGIKVPAALFRAILMALAERDETAKVCTDAKGNPEPDPELRDYENVPLKDEVDEYMKREVLPYMPDAWVDESKTKVGYVIRFNRYFYEYTPPRKLEEIETELRKIEKEIADLLAEVTE